MKTDTPRTDLKELELSEVKYPHDFYALGDLCRELERELNASKAEIKEIRNALGDDGRRTHKELLELASKASHWREWKQKYIDLRNAHIAEGQDPAGTIWEHADKIQQELKASKAEVMEINRIMIGWKQRATMSETDLEASKAEVAKLNHQLLKTESDLLQSQDINSFLDAEFRIACKRAEKAEAEAIQLKAQYTN
jgi:predicted  nucleic acid-binding Zn-ribbon protein